MAPCWLSLRAVRFFCREQIYPIKTEITTLFSLLSQKKLNLPRQKNAKATTQRAKISYFSTKRNIFKPHRSPGFPRNFLNFFVFIKKKKPHSFCNDELSGALWSDCFALSITRSHFCLAHTHTCTCSAACSAVTQFVVISQLQDLACGLELRPCSQRQG